MSDTSSRRGSYSRNEDWILVIGALPVNGHQNAWRAVKDLLKRLPPGPGVLQKDHSSAKIQQVHIFTTAQGRYAVCRFSQSQQARNAFDWIGGNIWHGARIGAWLYRVGSEYNSSAALVDSWDQYPLKNTPLETFWGIGNAFLQRTPTVGPVSPTMRPIGPVYSPPPPPRTLTPSPTFESYHMVQPQPRGYEGTYWRPNNPLPTKRRKQPTYNRPSWAGLRAPSYCGADVFAGPIICNGSDEPVPYANSPYSGAILVA